MELFCIFDKIKTMIRYIADYIKDVIDFLRCLNAGLEDMAEYHRIYKEELKD